VDVIAFLGGTVGRMLDPALIAIVALVLVLGRKIPWTARLIIAVALSAAAVVAFTVRSPGQDLGIPITQTALGALVWGFILLGVGHVLKPVISPPK